VKNNLVKSLKEENLRTKIIGDIFEALEYAKQKHPAWDKNIIKNYLIVCKEFGEVTKEINDYIDKKTDYKERIIYEMNQLAAMCIRFLENIEGMER
jgi:hypothetical protein